MNKELTGFLSLLLGVALFSTIEIASKFIGNRVDPYQLVFMRFSVTGIILMLFALPGLKSERITLRASDYGILLLNGFVGIAVSIPVFHYAILKFDNASSSAVVFSAHPIFTILFARFINGEMWNIRKFGAIMIGAIGVLFFSFESGKFTADSFITMSIMMASGAGFALSVCISKRYISRLGVYVMMGGSSIFGSLMVLPIALMGIAGTGPAGIIEAWKPLLYICVIGTAGGYGFYYYGILNTTVFRASTTFFVKPVLAAVLAYIPLGDKFNLYTLVGMAVIIFSLFLSILPDRKKEEPQSLTTGPVNT
ncbi:MAG: DMT family transporter [Lentisphaerae bacterium]|nr:DMT family transporter [Lentisphaerota bacterium]